jgi:molybdopterin molybdotransferase
MGVGEKIQPGKIYDSNSVLLGTLLRKLGARVLAAVSCRDERTVLEAAMREGATANAMIMTGGVSVGAHDLVQECLRGLGGMIDVWRVAIKPGKPFLFGNVGGCAVFGLPGNPVSAYVTFLKFVRPALLKMSGANGRARDPVRIQAKLSQDLQNDGDRVHYFRGRYDDGMFVPVGRQESHALFGLSRSNTLARIEPGAVFSAGAMIEIELWD